MPAATTPPAPPTPAAPLATWETTATPTQLTAQAPHQEALLAWLTDLHHLLASTPALPGSIAMDDVSTVLCGAGAMRAAKTETTGPARTAEALRQLLSALPSDADEQPARRALLFIVSSTAAPLEMDELSEITETIHTVLLRDEGEMVFGHSEQAMVAAGAMQVWLLLALPGLIPEFSFTTFFRLPSLIPCAN
ncbi:hypothetical protein [Hymenobacter cheonanensis]|uniref:hypothetical protein n=1 Tax=Hymenobacter sp. CA2-7 TaxID=3063993 RepID=UPI002713EDBD|nr:hypothetical protein [Hymenobacter sp. CA2-7]MDO7887913.1 hypothetical protein [Hymenobacter sp. CA2-7]